ncbi:hypothetical protein [Enterococcus sp. AZ128]|uniref:hypothetical protein n=1 Tax=unclassified Enterococcus TaxID=2608891 RepID=UPI003F687A2D
MEIMENYTVLSSTEILKINGGGKYDKQGYQLGQNVGRFVKGAVTIWGLFK